MAETPPALAIQLLGGAEVKVHGEPLPHLRSRQGLRLLAFLALRAPRAVERRFLAGLLWPESTEEVGLALLRRTLTDLRKALGSEGERLASPSRHTLQLLDSPGLWRDTARLEEVLAQEGSLDEALALYRGPLLEGFHEEWLLGERERYQLLFLTALERRAAQAPPDEAISLLRRLLALDPLRETACRSLLEALAARGDTAGLSATYRQFRRSLRKLLHTEPDETTTQLYRRLVRSCTLAPPTESERLPSSLPQPLTVFFGRATEHTRLQGLLERSPHRLITLIGPGGVGKTRLATEVAHAVQAHFSGGIYFLPLAELTLPGQVLTMLAQAVGAAPGSDTAVRQRVVKTLTQQERPVLLVLDNLEHLLAHPDSPRLLQLITTLLAESPNLTCLATSRLALRLSGEREVPIPPLELPEQGTTLEALQACPSVALFRDRVQAIRPEFELTVENAPLVSALCRELEGSPLALELAAGALRVLPLAQVLRRLGRRLDLMADRRHDVPERHRSLRTVLEWSYRLLPRPLQHFFADLSVFRGGCDQAAILAICESPAPLEALATLEEHSLLQLDLSGEGRYFLQEVVREFAAERLVEQGRHRATQSRHAAHFGKLAAQVSEGLLGPEQAHWHAEMDRDFENVRAALDNLAASPTDENTERYLQLIADLSRFWERRSHFHEAYQRCLTGIQLHGERPVTELSARALLRMGVHCWRLDELPQSRAYTLAALAYYEASGDLGRQCDGYQNLGNLVHLEGDNAEAERLFALALERARQAGDPYRTASLLGNRGFIAAANGALEQAEVFYEEQLALRRTLGDLGRVARSLTHLGAMAFKRRDFSRARRYLTESLALHRQFKNAFSIASVLSSLGELAFELGEYAEAERLWRAALEGHQSLGLPQETVQDIAAFAQLAHKQSAPLAALRLAAAAHAHGAPLLPEFTELRAHCLQTYGPTETEATEFAGAHTPLETLVKQILNSLTLSDLGKPGDGFGGTIGML